MQVLCGSSRTALYLLQGGKGAERGDSLGVADCYALIDIDTSWLLLPAFLFPPVSETCIRFGLPRLLLLALVGYISSMGAFLWL